MKTISSARDYDTLFQEFWPIYKRRPVKDNSGGTQLPQLFGLWVFLREESPQQIIESGAWKGQTTWLMHDTCQNSSIVSIDPVTKNRQWEAPDRIRYSEIDFSYQDWTSHDKEKTLVFFDDHINEYKRLLECIAWRFKTIIFEDNYPANAGDPSIRQILGGHEAGSPEKGWRTSVKAIMRRYAARFDDYAQRYEPKTLQAVLTKLKGAYEEFPPLMRIEMTRWGIPWDTAYPEVTPCLDLNKLSNEQLEEVRTTAAGYTSIARVSLKG